MKKEEFLNNCNQLLQSYKTGEIGATKMPEDSHPNFSDAESRITYFTLSMALNYQRDSFKLWEFAKKTFEDPETNSVFNLQKVSQMSEVELKNKLTKHKLALQPKKHIQIWKKISQTILENFGSFSNLFQEVNFDFLQLQSVVQKNFKQGFPYLSGPKIFHYWSFILGQYGGINLKNKEFIEIAPDTHIIKGSIKLGVITEQEADSLPKDKISERWRNLLKNSNINPIDMHPPLWFWSRNKFQFKLK